jgi:UDP-N-acetylmuramoyl-tripeptide--D-alanyl-D-alanine ligase
VIPLTLAELAEATDGVLAGDPDVLVTGPVEFDSRKVAAGALFVAFPGSTVDGHDFAAAAVEAGAVAVLSTRPVPVPHVLVGDALTALARLARYVVDRLPELTIVGITGSSGKTSTKDVIAQLLAHLGPTVAPAGSFNNELGLPHTVLRAGVGTRFLVLEMGARGVGHIRYLCEIAPPRIGVEVNVGVAHIGEFGTVEAIAKAKAELVEALPPDGVAVLNADDPRVRAMAALTSAGVLLAGTAPDAAVRAEDPQLDERGRATYTLVTAAGSAPVRLRLSGAHQIGNTLLAAAVATAVGMPVEQVAAHLAEVRPLSSRRMDVFDRADGVTVIDDSYNANPASAAAALHALDAIGRGRRRIAVLGYLAELGEHEQSGHEEVGALAARLGVDLVVAVSGLAAGVCDGAAAVAGWGGESVQVTDQEAAIGLLAERLRPGDVVLVKGSRYRTWDVADWLRSEAQLAGAEAAAQGRRAQ